MIFDAYASLPHYLEYLLPIWRALDEDERGTFHVHDTLLATASRNGVLGSSLSVQRDFRRNLDRPLLVASFADHQEARPRTTIMVEHGAGQTYLGCDNPSYAGSPGRERVGLFLCPNIMVADRNRRRYPHTPTVVVGCLKFDVLPPAPINDKPVVCVGFHWPGGAVAPEATWALPHYRPVLNTLAATFPSMIGAGHPKAWSDLHELWENIGVEPVREFTTVCERADVYVCDNSSTLFEFAALDRPVVVLNAPWYRREIEHGLRFWECADVGVQVAEPDDLVWAIQLALDDPLERRERRRVIAHRVFGELDGQAAQRAVAAMRSVIHWPREDDVTASDPYRGEVTVSSAPLTPPEGRLTRMGATPEDLVEANRRWAEMTDDERLEATAAFDALTDDEVRELVEETHATPVSILPPDPDLPGGNVQEILAWVGNDVDRARQALDHERAGSGRKGLVSRLERLLADG